MEYDNVEPIFEYDYSRCFDNKKADFMFIKKALQQSQVPFVFSYAPNEFTSMVIMIADCWFMLNSPTFGGNPSGHVFVGILRVGFFHLPKKELYPDYVMEKFGLPEPDAKGFCDLWNYIFKKEEEENVGNNN